MEQEQSLRTAVQKEAPEAAQPFPGVEGMLWMELAEKGRAT